MAVAMVVWKALQTVRQSAVLWAAARAAERVAPRVPSSAAPRAALTGERLAAARAGTKADGLVI